MDEREREETVRQIARKGDPDRFLAALFAPREARPDLYALIAFNVELSGIPERVTEPELGAIRLQWWRDALVKAAKGERTGHPVVDALSGPLAQRRLSRERLEAMIDARSFDVAVKIVMDWPSLETYLAGTSGALFALAGLRLGADEARLASAAHKAGIAYGLTGLMRALPRHTSQGRVLLPADLLRAHGISSETVLARTASEGLYAALAGMRAKAGKALGEARREVAALDPSVQVAFLPLGLVEPYLAALERTHDPLREVVAINPLLRLWRVTRWQP